MTGVAKTLDKAEEKTRRIAGPLTGNTDPGSQKRKYGQYREVDTSEGYAAGEDKKVAETGNAYGQQQAEAAKEAERSAAEAVLQTRYDAQRKGLSRKGRRASILTSITGDADNQLGSVGRPAAMGL